jgi:hypothetical protein
VMVTRVPLQAPEAPLTHYLRNRNAAFTRPPYPSEALFPFDTRRRKAPCSTSP